ncbi:carbohydrate sulfotransferase 1-like isoform X2 [Ruditapes philippinarum]|uniref:carbohydrate sulfotransferase 1-like isoform X2 n=1 Tax=Ruditapes philippinarum TaxID=129788 RepID=UPI00295BD5D4|nr:carbohydrate sulfotransferase 1-like isoform X2 [Ruditapes philippinarum]
MRRRAYVRLLAFLVVCYTTFGFVTWYGSYQRGSADELISGEMKQSNFAPVVVVAYMRSGSTLTGNLIQQNPDTFYVFEPLHDIIRGYQKEKEIQFPKTRFVAERPLMDIKEEVDGLYRAWFTCDMEYILSEPYRYHVGFFKHGHKTKLLLKCLDNTTYTLVKDNAMPCTNYLQKLCMDSKYRVLKTIRTPLIWFKTLMEEFPNMKIVHLVRDPRAILTSQRRFGECSTVKHGGLAGCTRFVCSSLEDDLLTFEIFTKLFPGRIYQIKYEDIALNPLSKTKELYRFLNLKYTDSITKYIVNITMSGNNATYTLDTVRPNSSEMIDKWRTKISDELLDTAQAMCKFAMKALSYYHFIKPMK